jgi:hypothetical protein
VENTPEPPLGRPLRVDSTAESAEPGVPAFVARPKGSPVYYGFPILEDVAVDGFKLGMITDWEAQPDERGDAYVIAPDGSRAGLVWEVYEPPYFQEVIGPEPGRWGVWGVAFPLPMTSRQNARHNLEAVLPELKARWLQWQTTYARSPGRS